VINKEPQGIERGRTLTRISSIAKYGGAQAGANFRGRKSNSLMNLCGGKDEKQIQSEKLFSYFAILIFFRGV
jgi:calmodulin-regulated spectrin-associated protein